MIYFNYVYAIGGRYGGIKIGFTGDPMRRLKALQNGYDGSLRVLGLWYRTDAADIEYRAHRLLEPWRIHGEWFRVTPLEAFDAVAEAIRAVDKPPQSRPPTPLPIPEPVVLPDDSHRLGYARDFCRTPLEQQRSWLLASGVDQLDIFQDLTRTRRDMLNNACQDMQQGDVFCVWSPDVVGSEDAVADLLGLAQKRGARILFAHEESQEHD